MPGEIVVIGGGPAGLAAAAAASDAGCRQVLLIERDRELGGILNQCVHDGFGNLIFGGSMTGPEYAHRFIREVRQRPAIAVLTGTMVLSLARDRRLTYVNRDGVREIQPGAVILAMGCRERSRFQAFIPGYRPAGVYTAGTAQRLINMEGVMPGENAVILGSGDVGLIMARRLTLEGANVLGVFEIAPRPGGLTRNVVQCLDDFQIPLFLEHTVTFIHGKKRLTGVSVAPLDRAGKPDLTRERFIACDTLILSVGLIPENELSRQAGLILDPVSRGPVVDQEMSCSVPGIYAGGNVVHVHDLVDYVSHTARLAGRGAQRFLEGRTPAGRVIMQAGENVSYIIPQSITLPVSETVDLYLRVREARRSVHLKITHQGNVLKQKIERIVRPPEMIHLALEPALLTGLSDGHTVSITVSGGEPA
ncbi:MAG: FAD-dependent oxidoreductase [Bacillota bacterium]